MRQRLRPEIAAGALTALVTGGLMAALTASAGGLAASLPAIGALTMALAVCGALFGWLVESERLRMGFGPGIVFWIAVFPLARLTQELMAGGGGRTGLGQGMGGFLVYQAIVGGAFGLGFVILHNQIAELIRRAASRPRRGGGAGG